MNREDICQIATESWLTEYGKTLLLRGDDIEINIEELERFAALVAAAEREACQRRGSETEHKASKDGVRELPAQSPRVETGPTRFGDDWCGVFIRGDSAFSYAMTLREIVEVLESSNERAIESGE